MSVGLERERILSLLGELGRRLDRDGTAAALYIVGGAAMAIAYSSRRATHDIDALFEPSESMTAHIAAIAAEEALPADWLNGAARAFVPGEPDVHATLVELLGITLSIGSPRHVLAMKMAAFRPQDLGDIDLLMEMLAITDAAALVSLTVEIYGDYLDMLVQPDDLALRAELAANRAARRRPS